MLPTSCFISKPLPIPDILGNAVVPLVVEERLLAVMLNSPLIVLPSVPLLSTGKLEVFVPSTSSTSRSPVTKFDNTASLMIELSLTCRMRDEPPVKAATSVTGCPGGRGAGVSTALSMDATPDSAAIRSLYATLAAANALSACAGVVAASPSRSRLRFLSRGFALRVDN